MLLTNQRLDKLAAARVDFVNRGMLPPASLPPQGAWRVKSDRQQDSDDSDDGAVDVSKVEMVQGNVILARKRSVYTRFYLLKLS
jgi:hypothetical protein